ncbi:MAG: hypothetical protein L6R37_004505 [Teloschistes peruensis]|nr:MAG: hypothetical protein L6R37_004505 [Teloschistes peruensis]
MEVKLTETDEVSQNMTGSRLRSTKAELFLRLLYAKIFEGPIEPTIIGGTIRRAQHNVKQIMKIHGDSWVPEEIDPYTDDPRFGCYFYAKSNPLPGPGGVAQHLTWGILNSTLEGLYQIAYVQGYSQEMNWRVVDSKWGQVGNGYIKAGSADPDLGVIGEKAKQTGVADS